MNKLMKGHKDGIVSLVSKTMAMTMIILSHLSPLKRRGELMARTVSM